MSLHQSLFELCIAYNKDNEGMAQAEYLRAKLGDCRGGMQTQFSRLLQATKPEWYEKARLFRETGKRPFLAQGSYKEQVFKNAVRLWDHHQNENDSTAHDQTQENAGRKAPATKRKLANSSKTTRASRSTRVNKKTSKVVGKSSTSSPLEAKRRRTLPSPEITTGETTEADESPISGAAKKPLELLKDGFHQVQLQHNSMKCALAEARKSNKELQKEKSALENELERISESREKESESLGKLKVENKMLQDTLAARANDTAALARKRATNKKLKKENATLKTKLENTKEEQQLELAKEADRLAVQQKANGVLRQQIVNLRSELEQLAKLHCRTMESFSVQTRLLQDQCKTLVSPGVTSCELRNPNDAADASSKQSDEVSHRARRISL